ncbi:MAG: hypothetical protein V3U87_17265 [Methylococcaceae bacterium]
MKKTDKKREKSIVQGLTRVCEIAKNEVSGFEWLTHTIDYDDFPNSLMVHCIFTSDESIRQVIDLGQDEAIFKLIYDELVLIDINFKDISHRVTFDTK